MTESDKLRIRKGLIEILNRLYNIPEYKINNKEVKSLINSEIHDYLQKEYGENYPTFRVVGDKNYIKIVPVNYLAKQLMNMIGQDILEGE